MNRTAISDDVAQFFLDNGCLIVRGAVEGSEFDHVRAAADDMTQTAIHI